MSWRSRTLSLYAELSALAMARPWWWLIAGGVAATETLPHDETYLACDAEPDADTLIAYPSHRPRDLVADAIARAHAARAAIRELDGTLPAQPLAVTIQSGGSSTLDRGARVTGPGRTLYKVGSALVGRLRGARLSPSSLEVAAFAFGDRVLTARLDDPDLRSSLLARLSDIRTSGQTTNSVGPNYPNANTVNSVGPNYPIPFVCVSIGDEPLETARHGHRRAWTASGGPWLGLGRAEELAIVSTCHLVVDGYGHARLAARIAELVDVETHVGHDRAPRHDTHVGHVRAPSLAPVPGGIPLSIARRELVGPLPRVIPLAYRLGCILQRDFGHGAAFSPTIQIPVALGAKTDPLRLRRRVVAASLNVRFDARGEPEPFAEFEARVRGIFAREAASQGLVSRLLASGRAIPAPLGWKRRGIAAKRPAWLEGFANVIGGRALLSRISVDATIPMSYAVSSPSRMASELDPVGGCVITLVDDGKHGAITLCGSGRLAAETILDELLATVAAAA